MDELLITGGQKLKGQIPISGSKNAVLPILAASLIVPGTVKVQNVPQVKDVGVMCGILENFGATTLKEKQTLQINAANLNSFEAPYDMVRRMRASVLLIGPLLARCGRARVSMPGGCAIGTRPIDIHLKAFSQMGADVDLEHGMIDIKADRLKGSEIYLDFPSHTGTENIMMAAVGARGETTITNAAREPEIKDLARFLIAMGAKIEGAGTEKIIIKPPVMIKSCTHSVIPDRIEAGTYAIAAVITGGELEISNVIPEHLTSVLAKLGQTGADIEVKPRCIKVRAGKKIRPVNLQTAPYPGYPTDLQAQFMALLCLAEGESVITERIFENRYMHVGELNRMGANIVLRDRNAMLRGVPSFMGAEVMATDLRASASLVLAGLAAEGKTTILRMYHLDRGYENLVEKLSNTGACIQRISGRNP